MDSANEFPLQKCRRNRKIKENHFQRLKILSKELVSISIDIEIYWLHIYIYGANWILFGTKTNGRFLA